MVGVSKLPSTLAAALLNLIVRCLLAGICLPAAVFADNPTPNVHVFIVAIGHFDDSTSWPTLDAAQTRATEVIKFFKDTYALTDAQIDVYSDQRGNADEADLHALQKKISQVASEDRSIVFLFIMSHGKVVDSSEFSRDLLIVASNTPGNSSGNEGSSVLGSGFLKALGYSGEQSIAFAFFDTCSSGALALIADRIEALYAIKHQNVIAISSSGANQKSYDFGLTSAILRDWNTDTDLVCQRADTAIDKFSNAFTDLLSYQNARVLTDRGKMCLNAISKTKGVLFMLGHDQEGTLRFTSASGAALHTQYVQRTDFAPLMLMAPRAGVRVELYDPDNQSLVWPFAQVDLITHPLGFLDLGIRVSPDDPYTTPRTKDNITISPMVSPVGAQFTR